MAREETNSLRQDDCALWHNYSESTPRKEPQDNVIVFDVKYLWEFLKTNRRDDRNRFDYTGHWNPDQPWNETETDALASAIRSSCNLFENGHGIKTVSALPLWDGIAEPSLED